jgi:hypothetical protein
MKKDLLVTYVKFLKLFLHVFGNFKIIKIEETIGKSIVSYMKDKGMK